MGGKGEATPRGTVRALRGTGGAPGASAGGTPTPTAPQPPGDKGRSVLAERRAGMRGCALGSEPPPAGTKPPNPRPGDPATAAVTADRRHAPPSSSAAGGSEDLKGARPSSESLAPGGLSPGAESGCGNDQGGGQSAGSSGARPGWG